MKVDFRGGYYLLICKIIDIQQNYLIVKDLHFGFKIEIEAIAYIE